MSFTAACFAAAYFGLNFNPAATNSPTDSRIYPVTPKVYRMVQPDGQVKLFTLTDPKAGVLSGPRPWLGVKRKNRTDIWADPECTGGKLRTAYTFIDGRLRLLVLDGAKYTFAHDKSERADLAELFPPRKLRSYAKNSNADIWSGTGNRIRLWFANPNSAGALMAQLSLLLAWVMIRQRRGRRALATVFLLGSLYLLFATGSRGALLGLLLGGFAFGVEHVKRVFTKKGLVVVGIGLAVLTAGLVATGNLERCAGVFRGLDASNLTRVKIGRAAVEMFADAPMGWHGGEVPGRNACLNWYVHDEPRSLRTHLMSLAECGWFVGFLYLAFWIGVIAIGILLVRTGEPLVAAVWVAFGVAGCFNPVYIDWETWVVPSLSFVWFARRLKVLPVKAWRTLLIGVPIGALAFVIALVVIGSMLERKVPVGIRSSGATTLINGNDPKIWIVGDPLVMAGGGFPGREILPAFVANPKQAAMAYVYSVDDLPTVADLVVVAGRNVPDYFTAYTEGRACKAKRLILLSPSVGPKALPAELLNSSELVWIAGSLLADRDPSYAVAHPWMKIVPGCERYIPNWLRIVTRAAK